MSIDFCLPNNECIFPNIQYIKALFTLVMKAEEKEESLCPSVNHENGDGSTSGCSIEAEMGGTDLPFSSIASFVSVKLISQTLKCEPGMMKVQAEIENENAHFQPLSRISCKHASSGVSGKVVQGC